MYKLFDSPKSSKDIVNKEYVDSFLRNNCYIFNKAYIVQEEDWQVDNDNYTYTLNHNLDTKDIIIQFFNEDNENIPIYFKIIDKNTIFITSNSNIYLKIIINYASDALSELITLNKVVDIYEEDWFAELNGVYSYIINHNLNTKNIIVNFYNDNYENIQNINYRIVDENSIIVFSDTRTNEKVVINYTSSVLEGENAIISETIYNTISLLQNKVNSLEEELSDIKETIPPYVPIEKIEIYGLSTINTSQDIRIKEFSILSTDFTYSNEEYSYILNHNLNTSTILIDSYNTNKEKVYPYIKIIDDNNIQIISQTGETLYVIVIYNYIKE